MQLTLISLLSDYHYLVVCYFTSYIISTKLRLDRPTFKPITYYVPENNILYYNIIIIILLGFILILLGTYFFFRVVIPIATNFRSIRWSYRFYLEMSYLKSPLIFASFFFVQMKAFAVVI